ncbi:MAG: zinc ribbon domain-containing protein [Ilumatobacter sp.]
MTTCDQCGAPHRPDAKFCGVCGASVTIGARDSDAASDSDDVENRTTRVAPATVAAPGDSTLGDAEPDLETSADDEGAERDDDVDEAVATGVLAPMPSAGSPSSRVEPPAFGETGAPVLGAAGVAAAAAAAGVAAAGSSNASSGPDVSDGVGSGSVAGAAAVTGAAAMTATTAIPAVGSPPLGSGGLGGPPPAESTVATAETRGASVMIAALAIAAVVIIGGVIILFAAGSDGDDAIRTDPDATAPTSLASSTTLDGAATPPTTEPPPSPSSVPVSTLPTTSLPETSLPVGPVETTIVPPTSLPPSTTAPPTTAPPTTAPPTTVIAGRGPGDLGLAQPILDWPCTGDYITFVRGVVGGAVPYPEQVSTGLGDFPGSGYLWGGLCPSIRTATDGGDDIYGIVFGPYDSAAEACAVAADFSEVGAYVRQFTASTDDIGRDVCG